MSRGNAVRSGRLAVALPGGKPELAGVRKRTREAGCVPPRRTESAG